MRQINFLRVGATAESEYCVEGAEARDSGQQGNDAMSPNQRKGSPALFKQQPKQCQTEQDATEASNGADVCLHDASSAASVTSRAVPGFATMTSASRARAPLSEFAIRQPCSARSSSSRALIASVSAGTVSLAKVV